ncbi:MAG: serine/threonine-protein kinase [Pirellulaceae bacterium]|jgi:serine/threonine-protein kinase
MNQTTELSAEAKDFRLAELLVQISHRRQRGEGVELESFCRQFPEHASELRSLWGVLMLTEAAAQYHDTPDPTLDPANGQRPPAAAAQLPRVFGDFVLLCELGRGGMGVVYLADQPRLGRLVAVKCLLEHRALVDTDRKRFLAEAQANAKLDHHGIVPVYQVGEQEGTPYIAMQYVPGVNLAQRLLQGPLPTRQAVQWISQVARAVHFAHQQGVLHRDLKPSNILIDEHQHARLTDFGLAKIILGDSLQRRADLTATGDLLGTPMYMSPEQASGSGAGLGPQSDIYSLGAVLYELLTGRPPHRATTPLQWMREVIDEDPIPPRMLQPSLDRGLEMILIQCLQKPPDLRYSSAEALADDLDAYLADEPIQAQSGHLVQVFARLFRETHHAAVLENWGLLWMWHAVVLLIASAATEAIRWSGTLSRIPYAALWVVGLSAWAAVFWLLRRRMGPVTFVERQIAHVWGASMIATASLFPLEAWLELPPLALSPLLGVISGMVFIIKAGILSGIFYIQAICLFLCAIAMAIFPDVAHLIFGVVSAACFWIPGAKYHRQSRRPQQGKAL